MEAAQPQLPASLTSSPNGSLRPSFSDALRFWEFRRIFYNLALAVASFGWVVATWPHFRPALTMHSLLLFSVLALVANACYCVAYLVDIPIQLSSLAAIWKRYRWALWLVGTLFAFLLANYWIADEIYPDFR
jgi:hypothetical protein